MKHFISIFFIMCYMLTCSAEVLVGEVEFKDNTLLENNSQDCNSFEHSAIKNGTSKNYQNREVTKFSDGSYGIRYFNDPMYGWFYDTNGKLTTFTKRNTMSYPAKMLRYNNSGHLINYSIKISEQESYVYSKNGELIAHWVGDTCYNRFNEIIMTRHKQ